MQKRKFIPLSTLLLCSLCLGACSCNKPSDTDVIAIVNGEKIKTDYVYDLSLYNSDVAAYVYGVLEKALIESSIKITPAMRATAENETKAFENKIKNDALLNGTDYKEDLKAALKEEGASNLEELKSNKIYALQKKVAKTLFLNEKGSEYTTNFVRVNNLYHIGDITLAVSGSSSGASDYYGATISTTEAEKIHDAILELVEGDPYYDVAIAYSSADSKNNGGEEGIITLNDTDITNELRYALVGYSSIIEGKYNELKANLKFEENLTESPTLNTFYNSGLESIPLSYVVGLKDNYDTSNCYNDRLDSVYTNSKVYYRNILFNNLLNTKTPKFITLTEEEVTKYNAQDRVISASEANFDVLLPKVQEDGYEPAPADEEQYVLVNEENNPYIVYRDSKGLHITTIHMTPFTSGYEKYFSNEVDDEDGVYIYAEYGHNQEERLEEVNSFADRYITREFGSNSGDDKLLDFAIFEYWLSKTSQNGNFKIHGEVEKMINQYISSAREYADLTVQKDTQKNYDTYANSVYFRRVIVNKEVPILSCLTKDEKNKYMCTYEYGKGFAYYNSGDTQNGGGN